FRGGTIAYVAARLVQAPGPAPGLPSRSEERPALVLAEHVAHRPARLADRGPVAERVPDRVEQVAVAAGDLAKLVEASVHGHLVAGLLESLQALDLAALRLGIDLQDLDVVDLLGHVLVHPNDDVLTGS